MSEEEIIKRINYVIDKWYDENLEIDCRWIEGLLDLYNKEKKEINRLQEENNQLKLELQYALNTNNKDILKHWRKK